MGGNGERRYWTFELCAAATIERKLQRFQYPDRTKQKGTRIENQFTFNIHRLWRLLCSFFVICIYDLTRNMEGGNETSINGVTTSHGENKTFCIPLSVSSDTLSIIHRVTCSECIFSLYKYVYILRFEHCYCILTVQFVFGLFGFMWTTHLWLGCRRWEGVRVPASLPSSHGVPSRSIDRQQQIQHWTNGAMMRAINTSPQHVYSNGPLNLCYPVEYSSLYDRLFGQTLIVLRARVVAYPGHATDNMAFQDHTADHITSLKQGQPSV